MSSPQPTVRRDRAAAMSHYEPAWKRFRNFLVERLERGEDLIPALDAHWRNKIDTFFGRRLMTAVRARLEDRVGTEALEGRRLAVEDGEYRLVPDELSTGRIVRDVVEEVRRRAGSVGHVVELGSGIGENLFRIHAALTPAESGSLRFVGCEITESGRDTMRRLRSHAPGMDLSVQPFDYYRPDYEFLPPGADVLVFTSHSIEQIPRLPAEALTGLLERTGRCACVHSEPCGWQRWGNLVARRSAAPAVRPRRSLAHRARKRGVALLERLSLSGATRWLWDEIAAYGLEVPPDLLDRPDLVAPNGMRWSRFHDYNTDLLDLLGRLEAEGRLRVSSLRPDLYGDNPFNPSTSIHWEKLPEGAPAR